jgi:phosphopantothenoylcysteine synthetase/decarboxylase
VKPLLIAPSTSEDLDVMAWRFARGPVPTYAVNALDKVAIAADRRDAALMLVLAQERVAFGRFMWPESLYDQYLADGGDGLSAWE